MDVQELDREVLVEPVVNSWRKRPSREAVRFAIDLCRSELPYAQRSASVASLGAMGASDVSEMIDRLKELRATRLARLRGKRRRR